MIGSATILYASVVVHFGVHVAYAVGYGRLLNNAVAAISSQDLASSAGVAEAVMAAVEDEAAVEDVPAAELVAFAPAVALPPAPGTAARSRVSQAGMV